jgi:pre-mRNA-splicing factor ATP-dependent RNA helicase DHX15/PRP43
MKDADDAKLKFSHHDGDHTTMLNAYNAFKMKKEDNDWAYKNFLNVRNLKAADDIRDQL